MNQKSDFSVGLHHPSFEKGSCGFGLIANRNDRPSHWLVETAVKALSNMAHRGAIASDGKSGDGCGILIKMPGSFFESVAHECGFHLDPGFAVGMIFLAHDESRRKYAKHALTRAIAGQSLHSVGWRDVPVNHEVCGEEAKRTCPFIAQLFINRPNGMSTAEFERRLFLARRHAEREISADDDMFYVSSLSSKTVTYKGLVMPRYLSAFYPELADGRMISSLSVFHQRFSTNTWPHWSRAQPFRYLAHNGEINTIRGNRNWARARSHKIHSALLRYKDIVPVVSDDDSDSCSLDNMLEILVQGGMDVFRAMRLLVPPAWQGIPDLDPDRRAFYAYNSLKMEPWDGPAGIVLTDGRYGVCAMDRNGLRPARYVITEDHHIILGSEVGLYDYAPGTVVSKGRLGPGQLLAIDTETGKLLSTATIDAALQERQPYRKWLRQNLERVEANPEQQLLVQTPLGEESIATYQKVFLLTFEEEHQVLKCLAETGREPISSMGDDTPLPILSRQVRSLYDNFRQQFAQVTNPPIDPLREGIVMSLSTHIGREGGLFEEKPEDARCLLVTSPVLSESKFRAILSRSAKFPHHLIDLNYDPALGLEQAIDRLCCDAEAAVKAGSVILVLSDRAISHERHPIHALLATGAVHHWLIDKGLRCDTSILVETATARDPHHFATLIGYGATAIYPYLAYASLKSMQQRGLLGDANETALAKAYRSSINAGLYKIISKMGISTLASYRAAQLFEIVGLCSAVVNKCFKGTVSRVEGASFADLEQDVALLVAEAWNKTSPLRQGGIFKYVHGGEQHAFNPDVVTSLHQAVTSNLPEDYRLFSGLVNERPALALRDLLRLKKSDAPIPLEGVEPASSILKRFDTAAMSMGALSPTAHASLAVAMNRLGGRSNSGEGGEDPARYGTEQNSKIKQIASGRFGVTPHYLVNAEVLQIKIAQGAKPGEGGQLPANKVNVSIAKLRYATPGISLISPPPHHDIYSIEDLAQLIFDLKQINPEALVSVKLVSAPGIGTIAAGVTKAYADLITIAGHDGGTGASPLSSVCYAGCPWELGLSETHQALRSVGLRSRVRLQVDGGMKTGLDVIKGAILGAESFGFGTAPMIAMGCKYLRICHLNNCATGVATQNETLYTQYFAPDAVERAINYFRFVAEETRQIMASLGIAQLVDLIGRVDLLSVLPGKTSKQQSLSFDRILARDSAEKNKTAIQHCRHPRNPPHDKGELAEQISAKAAPYVADTTKPRKKLRFSIRNYNRSIGAKLSGEIARRYGNEGLADNPLSLKFTGTAGQSFGAWNVGGLELYLEGDANDYVGKGMHSGKIVIRPPKASVFNSNEAVILGNTCLYGATGGRLFAAGIAGERFAVRNSGAHAVVEGVGDHGCEYMTGGVVTVLGSAGTNFGAGMTGGFAFVLDLRSNFFDRYNNELIDIHRLVSAEKNEIYSDFLAGLIKEHLRETRSAWAKEIDADFLSFLGHFWLVKPKASDLNLLLDNLFAAA